MAVDTIERTDIEQTMRVAYLNYAMSVITARALPDVRDGLKPVQRRVLYAMADMGLRHDQPTRKSARIVGEVLGKYHPHGETAVYDAMVRMAQDFSMRYPLVHGQGNFGSVDGDSAAAMRYTEAKLSALGEELLIDLEKNTVAFIDNFDGSLKEPIVLPAKLPNLLLNGVGGIAVGMATNIPPHNLSEIADAIIYLIGRYATAEDVTVDDLMHYVTGPDFPTGGSIIGGEGIRQAYATGKGRVIVRAQAHVEDIAGGRQAIIITELPYQVNKAGLVERIADLVRTGRIEGIADLRDESDRTGMRVMVELKRGVDVGPVINQLLKYTQMQNTFGVNMLALVDGEPRVLSLKRILLHHIEHRHDVIVRRSQYDLEKARARAHVLEGLLIALKNLDEVIQIIRRSRTADTAMTNLCERFKLSEIQARAILDMQLRRLAALERQKIEQEYQEVMATIAYLEALLASKAKILDLIKEDLLDLKQRYGDPRRTRITAEQEDGAFSLTDLLPDERVMVLVSRDGSVRSMSENVWNGDGQGPAWRGLSQEDTVAPLAQFAANSRDSILFVTERGRIAQLAAHQVPDAAQQPRGLPLRKLAPQVGEERVVAALLPGTLEAERFLTMATRLGKVKRLTFSDLANANPGAQVIGLAEDDALGWAAVTDGKSELLLVTMGGQVLRFDEESVRPQGRAGSGVRGIALADGDQLVGMDVVRAQGELLIATAKGFAKRTALSEYATKGRATAGTLTVDATKTETTGPLVGAQVMAPGEDIVFITSEPRLVPTRLADVPRLARASWGRVVTRSGGGALVNLDGAVLTGVARLAAAVGSEPGKARAAVTRKAEAPAEAATSKAQEAPKAQPAETKAAKSETPKAKPRAATPKAQPATGDVSQAKPKAKGVAPAGEPTMAEPAEARPSKAEAKTEAPKAAPAKAGAARAAAPKAKPAKTEAPKAQAKPETVVKPTAEATPAKRNAATQKALPMEQPPAKAPRKTKAAEAAPDPAPAPAEEPRAARAAKAAPPAEKPTQPAAPGKARSKPARSAAPTAPDGPQKDGATTPLSRQATPKAAKGEPDQPTKERTSEAPAQTKPSPTRTSRARAAAPKPSEQAGAEASTAQPPAETPTKAPRKGDGADQTEAAIAPAEEQKPSPPGAHVRAPRVAKPPVRSRPKQEP
ncbi:MAG: DNA gyrase subunit A [Anaerolineae bacterium]